MKSLFLSIVLTTLLAVACSSPTDSTDVTGLRVTVSTDDAWVMVNAVSDSGQQVFDAISNSNMSYQAKVAAYADAQEKLEKKGHAHELELMSGVDVMDTTLAVVPRRWHLRISSLAPSQWITTGTVTINKGEVRQLIVLADRVTGLD